MKKVVGLANAAHVISLIGRILAILAGICLIIAMVSSFIMPSNLFSVDVNTHFLARLDFSSMGIPSDALPEIEQGIRDVLEVQGVDDEISMNVQTEGQQITLDMETPSTVISTQQMGSLLVFLLLNVICVYFVFRFVDKLAKQVKQDGTMLSGDVSRRVKKVGWMVLISVLLPPLLSSILQASGLLGEISGLSVGDFSLLQLCFAVILLLFVYAFSHCVPAKDEVVPVTEEADVQ